MEKEGSRVSAKLTFGVDCQFPSQPLGPQVLMARLLSCYESASLLLSAL